MLNEGEPEKCTGFPSITTIGFATRALPEPVREAPKKILLSKIIFSF
jgi:hypothetical protein